MQAAHRVAKNTGILYARMAITMFISFDNRGKVHGKKDNVY